MSMQPSISPRCVVGLVRVATSDSEWRDANPLKRLIRRRRAARVWGSVDRLRQEAAAAGVALLELGYRTPPPAVAATAWHCARGDPAPSLDDAVPAGLAPPAAADGSEETPSDAAGRDDATKEAAAVADRCDHGGEHGNHGGDHGGQSDHGRFEVLVVEAGGVAAGDDWAKELRRTAAACRADLCVLAAAAPSDAGAPRPGPLPLTLQALWRCLATD
jgi:hypothetical protein